MEVQNHFRLQDVQLYSYFTLSKSDADLSQDLRVIPFLLTTIFFTIQLFHFLIKFFKTRSRSPETEQPAHNDGISSIPKLRQHVEDLGGYKVFSFMLTRLIGSITLLVFSAIAAQGCDYRFNDLPGTFKDCPELFLTVTFLYTTYLSALSVVSKAHNIWPTRFNITILLATLAVYTYRDIWPLATFTRYPADGTEGTTILYTKIIVLAITGLGVPLFIPRRYVPLDPTNPMATPNPEQTASLFSMMTYTFLDPIIFLGYKVPHLSVDQLPPLSDRDGAKYRTEKAFPYIDAFQHGERRSLFWGLMKVYRKEYTILALAVLGYSLGGFAAPVGINRVLYYMETGGHDAKIRPWFWILWLFVGPMMQSLSFQWYIFIATRTLVRAEGLVTQLVFEHSLRIRMKAATSKETKSGTSTTNTPVDSAAVTPDNASAITDINSENTEQTETGGGSTAISRDPSTSSTLAPSRDSRKDGQKVPSKAASIKEEKSSEPSEDSNLMGKINNLVTTDLNNITQARDFLLIILYIPLQITFCMVFLYQVLGWSSLIGVSAMIVLLPLPGFVSSKIQTAQVKRMKMTDNRVQAVTESVNILRMIKLFGWEKKMSERLDKTRQEELQWIWRLKLLDQINGMLGFMYPVLTMLLSYSLYTVVMKETLTPSKIFSSMTVFNMLREQFYRLLRQSVDMIQGKVSLDRIEGFLNDTELLDVYLQKQNAETQAIPAPTSSSSEIGFKNATFTWSLDEDNGTVTPSRRQFKLRIKDELLFKRNAINLIIGPTGSGKTSMLMALLGEMHFVPSNPDSWFNLPRDSGIAYAAQESWVQNETIKNNILFRTPYDEARYNKVIKQCGLERDLELFDAGDATEVGERGLTLSGGQKARITLARAIYSNAGIILLDDVFAALDVHTSTWIIDHCFKGDLIKGRTVLLVTHNVALTSPIADLIVSIESDGKVKFQGTDVSSALKKNPKLASEVQHDREATEIGEAELELPAKNPPNSDGKLVIAEEVTHGHVQWKSYKLLLKGLGGNHPFIFYSAVLALLIVVEWGVTFQSWFLGYWGRQYQGHDPSEVDDFFYINTYAGIAVMTFFLNFVAYMFYVFGSMRASRSINKQLMDSVLGSTLRWLDETPTARIITRCTQDIRTIDNQLPQHAMWLLDCTIGFLTRLGIVIIFTPLFIFPGITVGAIGFYLGNMYLKAQLSVKRETSNARSPMISHFSAAIHGIVSIRAYVLKTPSRVNPTFASTTTRE